MNEEYFIYQTLAGVFPFDQVIDEDLIKRIEDYLVKAFREAKINTTWNEPDEKYEAAVIDFLHKILASESEFLKSFLPLQIIISDYGIINSLVQVTLKTTCPRRARISTRVPSSVTFQWSTRITGVLLISANPSQFLKAL